MTSPNDKKMYHFLFGFMPFWGHTRPCCILAARIAREHKNVIITLLLPPMYLKNARAEVSAELNSGDASEEAHKRVRLLSLYRYGSEEFEFHVISTLQAFPSAYKALAEGQPVTCATTGRIFDGISPPDAVFIDVFASPVIPLSRGITESSVPIIGFIPLHASYVIHRYGPDHMSGYGDLGAQIEAEAARHGITVKEVGDKVFYHSVGKIDRVPGLPPMYDWERFPQKLIAEGVNLVSDVLKLPYNAFKECDAFFSLTAYDFEPKTVDALKSWFAKEWNKEVYAVGPLLASRPTTYGIASVSSASEFADKSDPRSLEIEKFLDKSLKEYGEKSVLLFSFGSLFWPVRPEYINEVIEALIEKKFPFIISYAPPDAKIPDELMRRVTSSGIGFISKWVPQKFILNHPATGWFLTHAGQSGVLESLDSGVPMICWPFEFDQPLAAAHLSTNLNIAFELLEVRTGQYGMKPLLRMNGRKPQGTRKAVGVEIREVLEACRGERGTEMRRNAEVMKGKFGRAWGGEGISRRDFNAFLQKFNIALS